MRLTKTVGMVEAGRVDLEEMVLRIVTFLLGAVISLEELGIRLGAKARMSGTSPTGRHQMSLS